MVGETDALLNLPMFPVFIDWVVATGVFIYRDVGEIEHEIEPV